MSFQVGDRVRFLNEVGSGRVTKISKDSVFVEDEYGFEISHSPSNLVPEKGHGDIEQLPNKDSEKPKTLQQSQHQFPSIDLHLENLMGSTAGMSDHDKFQVQMNAFRNFLSVNERRKTARMLVVHGIGTGKLKAAIREEVQGVLGAEMHDANFSSKGTGASWIERKYYVR